MDMEQIKNLMDGFDPAKLIPELDSVLGWVELIARIGVMAGPVLLLAFGLWYLFLPPREANHTAGYRFYWGMGSVEAWRFTQKLAGLVWSALGGILTVVMFFLCVGFRGREMLDMITTAGVCLAWQVGLVLVSCIAIDVMVAVRFDRKGARRSARPRRTPRRRYRSFEDFEDDEY